MPEIQAFLDANPASPVGLAIACVSLVLIASINYRRVRGKPMFWPPMIDAMSVESWASGSGDANAIARFGGANNCLRVGLNRRRFQAAPHFPCSALFLPEVFGLEIDLPVARLLSLEHKRRWWTQVLDVGYRDDRGRAHTLSLRLRDAEGFRRAFEQVTVGA